MHCLLDCRLGMLNLGVIGAGNFWGEFIWSSFCWGSSWLRYSRRSSWLSESSFKMNEVFSLTNWLQLFTCHIRQNILSNFRLPLILGEKYFFYQPFSIFYTFVPGALFQLINPEDHYFFQICLTAVLFFSNVSSLINFFFVLPFLFCRTNNAVSSLIVKLYKLAKEN